MFLKLDSSFRYCKIEIVERNRNKTALTSLHELYRLMRVPVELKNALEPTRDQ